MRSREEIRQERREFEADVRYEVWRSGGNPDTINEDRVEEAYYGGSYPEESAQRELRAQRPKHEPEEQIDDRY